MDDPMDYGIKITPGERYLKLYCFTCGRCIGDNINPDALGMCIEEHESRPHG